jgi:hypothetical protein
MAKKKKFGLKLDTTIKNHIVQAILIFASVYFAFYINKLADDYKTIKRKNYAIESIRKELYRNSAIIDTWYEKHEKIKHRINDLVSGKNDSLKTELLKYDFLDLGILTNNESLMNDMLTNTAWETAKSTGIISEFGFETTQNLTYVYSIQQIIADRSIGKIVDFYFDMEAHKMDNLDAILIQFQLRFGELTGQEYLLKHLYKDAIKSVE